MGWWIFYIGAFIFFLVMFGATETSQKCDTPFKKVIEVSAVGHRSDTTYWTKFEDNTFAERSKIANIGDVVCPEPYTDIRWKGF